jgi:hypothetical protein
MLINASLPTINHRLATITEEDNQTETQTMKMPHPATSVPISSPIQLHLSQMLTTIKHTWPSLTTRPLSMAHKQ